MKFFKKKSPKGLPQPSQWGNEPINLNQQKTSKSMEENISFVSHIIGETSDLQNQVLVIGDIRATIFFLKSMVDEKEVHNKIIDPITNLNQNESFSSSLTDLEKIRERLFSGLSFKVHEDFQKITSDILNGSILVMEDGSNQAYLFSIGNSNYRSITESSTQTVVRGPKDSFTESLQLGYSLLRRRIRNPRLQFEEFVVGEDSRTTIAIGYMKGIVNEGILEEVRKRMEAMNTNAVLDSGNIEELITDQTFTTFPLIYNSERPDVIAGGIMEGKVAILAEGSPFVLLAPTVLTDFFQSPEDYYQSFFMGSFIRVIRYIAFLCALLVPSIYVSLVTYHHELIPTDLFISIQAQREGVPFPAAIEILLMEITFEVIREAGIRMPRVVGQTISIVGALVLGQAVVEAGIVSNILVIVVAFTAIASYVSPIYQFSTATRLLRFVYILAGSILGLYGVFFVLVIMVAHMVSLRSFGVPYLAPIAPFILQDQGDVFLRLPNWADLGKPSYLKSENFNHKKMHKPTAPKKGGES